MSGMKNPLMFIAVLATALAFSPLSRAADPPTVVELFTSQGCSSCPPADRILSRLAERKDLLALSFHVDYWNYIGWADPFSAPEYSARQRNYAAKMGLRHVYTPQIVVQGSSETVGSNEASVEKAIRDAKGLKRVGVTLSRREGGFLRIEISDAAFITGDVADVLFLIVDRRHETSVRRGENEGRKLVNTHVVRDLRVIGGWSGQPASFDIPSPDADGTSQGVAVLVQSNRTGRIYGAAQIMPLDGS